MEDEIFLAKIVSETLQSRGYEVMLESDGAKHLASFPERNRMCAYWISCCRIKMVLRSRMKSGKRIRQVPIIFLTAKSQTADVVNGFKMGANDYIRKPFSMEELIVRIENVLKQKTQPAGESGEVVIWQYMFSIPNGRRCIMLRTAKTILPRKRITETIV